MTWYRPYTAEAIIVGLVLFALDWSGFNKYQPSLFMGPKSFARIWWHLPLEIVGAYVLLRVLYPPD
jgi:hypothetical protein